MQRITTAMSTALLRWVLAVLGAPSTTAVAQQRQEILRYMIPDRGPAPAFEVKTVEPGGRVHVDQGAGSLLSRGAATHRAIPWALLTPGGGEAVDREMVTHDRR